jgi:hypothetical protein
MLKKALSLLLLPLLLGGCAATFSNLTPRQQVRNAENLYPVEVALSTRQHTLRWETIQAQVVVGNQSYPMRLTALMTNRWEGQVPVPQGVKSVHYHYKFDFKQDSFGAAKPATAASPEFTLRIVE